MSLVPLRPQSPPPKVHPAHLPPCRKVMCRRVGHEEGLGPGSPTPQRNPSGAPGGHGGTDCCHHHVVPKETVRRWAEGWGRSFSMTTRAEERTDLKSLAMSTRTQSEVTLRPRGPMFVLRVVQAGVRGGDRRVSGNEKHVWVCSGGTCRYAAAKRAKGQKQQKYENLKRFAVKKGNSSEVRFRGGNSMIVYTCAIAEWDNN